MLRGLVRPPALRPGDAVSIVAPAGPVPRETFEMGARLLGQRYELRYRPERLFSTMGYLAGDDDARLAELRAALEDRETRAVILARGGYGLLRLLPRIQTEWMTANPKPIVGFSDGTVLLAAAARAGVVAVHGPVITQLARLQNGDHQALFDLLESPKPPPELAGGRALVSGKARGPLIGGNIEVFSRLLGTPYLPDVEGAVLLLEEVGERPYRLDRLLTHLALAGVFQRVAGVILGQLIDCDAPGSPEAAQVVAERLGHLGVPVLGDLPIGHGQRNHALPHGALVALDADAGTVTALEGAVS